MVASRLSSLLITKILNMKANNEKQNEIKFLFNKKLVKQNEL